MATPYPQLWNKLGSQSEVTNSEIGSNLTEATVSPVYVPAIYGNGTDAPHSAGNPAKFHRIPIGAFPVSEFTIELWTKRTDTNAHNVQGMFQKSGSLRTVQINFMVNRPGHGYRMVFWTFDDASAIHSQYYYDYTNLAGFNSFVPLNQWIFWAWTFDKTASLTNRMKFYKNGINIPLSVTVDNAGAITGNNGTVVGIGDDGGNFGFGGIIDNLKIYNQVLTNFDHRFYEGITDITSTQKGQSKAKVYILGNIDIYSDVQNIIKLKEQKTFQRDKIINANYSLKVKNHDNKYSIDNPVSIFNNVRWLYSPLKIYDEYDKLLWDGIIRDIIRNPDNGTSNIITSDPLHAKMEEKIEYESSTWETPGDAWKNLCDDYDVGYDNPTVQTSISVFTAEACYIKVNFNLSDGIKLMAALEKLAEVGCADCYTHLGNLFYKHWTPYTGNVKASLTESDILKFSSIKRLESQIINQYRIGYQNDNGIPATDGAGDPGEISRQSNYFSEHSLPEMSTSTSEDQIMFKDLVSATYIGESYIKRTHIDYDTNPKPVQSIRISIRGDNLDWIDLQTFFSLTWADEGWTAKVFEVMMWEYSYSDNIINLECYEVDA